MTGYQNETDTINAYKYGRHAKVNIVIEINGIKKGISIKQRPHNFVHIEPTNRFTKYLKNLGFSETDKLLKYLYSDNLMIIAVILGNLSVSIKKEPNQY